MNGFWRTNKALFKVQSMKRYYCHSWGFSKNINKEISFDTCFMFNFLKNLILAFDALLLVFVDPVLLIYCTVDKKMVFLLPILGVEKDPDYMRLFT